MTINEKAELSKTRPGVMIAWSMITFVALQSSKYISGQLSIDGNEMMIMTINVAILAGGEFLQLVS